MELKSCTQCLGAVRFDGERKIYVCLYCDSEFEPPKPERDDAVDKEDIINQPKVDAEVLTATPIGKAVAVMAAVIGAIVLLSAVAFMFMTRNEMWMNTTTVTWSDVAWSESPVEPPVEVTSDIIHNIDQVIIFEDLTVTLNSIIFRRGGIFEDAGDGMQYVALGLTIQNASNEVNDFHSWGVRVYADNIRMQSAARGERYLGGVISGASLATGITVIRYSGFLIPLDIAELIIEIPSTSRDRELAIITVPVFGSGEQIGDVSVH